jgi:hypothetical protein
MLAKNLRYLAGDFIVAYDTRSASGDVSRAIYPLPAVDVAAALHHHFIKLCDLTLQMIGSPRPSIEASHDKTTLDRTTHWTTRDLSSSSTFPFSLMIER